VIDSRGRGGRPCWDHEESTLPARDDAGVSATFPRGRCVRRADSDRSGSAPHDSLPEARISVSKPDPGHPPFDNVLAISDRPRRKLYGWILFADGWRTNSARGTSCWPASGNRAGLQIRSTQVLCDVVQRHATSLQIEVTERRARQGRCSKAKAVRKLAEA